MGELLCACGCGEPAPGTYDPKSGEPRLFRIGHWRRTPEGKKQHSEAMKAQWARRPKLPCPCGCGEMLPVLQRFGYNGMKPRYVKGHDPESRERAKQREEWAARTTQMRTEREAGATLAEIGNKHGITRERVRQILKKSGGDPRPEPDAKPLLANPPRPTTRRPRRRRPHLVACRLSDAEKERFDALAKQRGCSTDALLRAVLLPAIKEPPGDA